MELNAFKRKSIHGMKWTIIISAIGLLFVYVLQLVLVAISPEALGIYSVFDIYFKFIAAFVLIGGAPVLSQYIPKIRDKENFIFTYAIFVVSVMLVALVLLRVVPVIFDWFSVYGSWARLGLVTLLPLVVINLLIQYALNGFLEIKSSAVLDKLPVVGAAVVVVIC
jgi:hypothetical protein